MTIYIDFKPHGPYLLPKNSIQKLKKTRTLKDAVFCKWLKSLSIASQRGVYIFALRNSSMTPWYVGLTTKSNFGNECTTPNTINKIVRAIQSSRGTPLFFFLEDTIGSAAATRAINNLETEMIRWCYSINPDLLNSKKKLRGIEIRIRGVLRSGSGKPSKSARALGSLLGEVAK